LENHKDQVENEKKELMLLLVTDIWFSLITGHWNLIDFSVFICDSSIYGSKAVRSFKSSYKLGFLTIEELNINRVCTFLTFLARLINYDYNSPSNTCKSSCFLPGHVNNGSNFLLKSLRCFWRNTFFFGIRYLLGYNIILVENAEILTF
jgi:hypothetical protein